MLSRLNLDAAKEHLRRFALIDSDKDGQISLEDFALYFKLPKSTPVKEIFSILDRVRLSVDKLVPITAFKLSSEHLLSQPNPNMLEIGGSAYWQIHLDVEQNMLESVLFFSMHVTVSRNTGFQVSF